MIAFDALVKWGLYGPVVLGVPWGLVVLPVGYHFDYGRHSAGRFRHTRALVAALLGMISALLGTLLWWYTLGPGVGDPKGWEIGAMISALEFGVMVLSLLAGYGLE